MIKILDFLYHKQTLAFLLGFFVAIWFCLVIQAAKKPVECWAKNLSEQPWLPGYCLTNYEK